MRITGSMQYTQLLKNLRYNQSEITDWQNKLATGQRIQKPGDDPVGISYLMRYDSELNRSEEFLENTRTGQGILRSMDSLLTQANDVLKRAKVLMQQASSGTVTGEQRKQISAEMKQLREQLVLIGNSSYNGRFLFNGQKTDQPPYHMDTAATDETDPGVFYLNVSPAVTVPVSLTGEQIFGEAGDPQNAFRIFDEMIDHLENNDQAAFEDDINNITICGDRISKMWAEIGARSNRFELVENRILDSQVSLKELRGKAGDVDMADAITQLKLKESILQAALSTGARISQISLIDFMR